MDYFKYFPTTEFDGEVCTNITLRNKIREYLKKNIYLYNDHIIQDFERPDILADKYYGNYKYTWLIFYANDILDPIRDWPATYDEFYAFINHKYQEVEWKPNVPYLTENKVQYNSKLYRCNADHTSQSILIGFRINDTIFKRETGTWATNYMVGDAGFFYNQLDRANGVWLPITTNNGVSVTVSGMLPQGCNAVEMYDQSKWDLYNDGILRLGYIVAHQTVHHYVNDKGLIVDFDTWYNDIFENITSAASDHSYDFTEHGTNRQIVRLIDINGNFYFIEMHVDFSVDPPRTYYTQEDISSYITSEAKQHIIQTFNVDSGVKRAVTNFQQEYDLNEQKRQIKLIDARYAAQILQEFKNLIKK